MPTCCRKVATCAAWCVYSRAYRAGAPLALNFMSLISDIWHYLQRRPCVRVTWDAKYERRQPAPGATPVVWDTEWLVSFQICDIVSTPVTLKRVAIRYAPFLLFCCGWF